MKKINENDYVLFWGGYFSNWYPSEFTVEGMTFNCGEQYMMYKKAMTFGDEESAQKVMNTSDPSTQKKIGRQVKGYDNDVWAEVRYETVKVGLVEKFKQNPKLKQYLLDNKDKVIVEASPYDIVWGIGYHENDENVFNEMENWGENLLGKMIMEIAQEL